MAEMENKLAATRMVPSCVSTQDNSCQTPDPSQLDVQMGELTIKHFSSTTERCLTVESR